MANAPASGPVSATARAWLLSPAPASRLQARIGRWYRAWLAFRRNPLGMSGLIIVLLLVLMAIFAPLIAERVNTSRGVREIAVVANGMLPESPLPQREFAVRIAPQSNACRN